VKRAVVFVASLVVAVVLASFLVPAREPNSVSIQGKSVLAWAAELNGSTPSAAVEIFRQAGEEAVPSLISALEQKGPLIKRPLFTIAGKLPDRLAYRLGYALGANEINQSRSRAAQALEIIGPKARAARPALRNALWDADLNLAMRAAFALASIGEEAVPDLVTALKAANAQRRAIAIHALGRVGTEAHQAAPVLIQLLEDDTPENADQAARSLGRIGRGAVPELVPVLGHPRFAVRIRAVSAFAEMGPMAREALGPLIERLKNEKVEEVRGRIVEALGRIRPSSETVVLALGDALKDEDSGVRTKAAQALGHGLQSAEPAVPALIDALKDASTGVRVSAADTLGTIGVAAQRAIPELSAMASHTNELIALRARKALRKIKPDDTLER